MGLHILKMPEKRAAALVDAICGAREKVRRCKACFNLSSGDLCAICSDESRDMNVICVVESSRDISSLERSKEYRGLYHVLLGRISPLSGIGPEELTIEALKKRVSGDGVNEVIIATSTDVEGEATGNYVSRAVAELGVSVSRIAFGVPIGGPLEFVDEITLGRAIRGRTKVDMKRGNDDK